MLQYVEQFVKLVQAVAWPGVVIWIVYLFRDQMGKLIERLNLKKMSFDKGKLEAEFVEKVEEVKEQVTLDGPHTRELPTGQSNDSEKADAVGVAISRSREEERLIELAAISTRAAITEAWLLLEKAIIRAVYSRSPGGHTAKNATISVSRYMMDAEGLGILLPTMVESVQTLRRLRNQAVHEDNFDISVAGAKAYIEVALTLTEAVEWRDANVGRTRPER